MLALDHFLFGKISSQVYHAREKWIIHILVNTGVLHQFKTEGFLQGLALKFSRILQNLTMGSPIEMNYIYSEIFQIVYKMLVCFDQMFGN